MKHLIVMNPNCGTIGDPEDFRQKIGEAFAGLEYEIYETTGPRSVIPYLKEYFAQNTEDTVRVYACGGDGTVHEAANALVGIANAELAVFPAGTGNDFVKAFGGKDRFTDFGKLIAGKAHKIDLTRLTGDSLAEPLYSINVINFGFDAIVGAMGNYYKEHGLPEEAQKKGLDPYSYALKNDAMKHGRFNDTEVFADGEKLNEKQILLCTIAQGQFVGGQFHCAPKSDNTDGMLDICVLKTMTYLGLGLLIGTYTRGEHLNKPRKKIAYRRAKVARFVAPKEIDVCVDGEMIKGKEFTAECIPGAISFVVPE